MKATAQATIAVLLAGMAMVGALMCAPGALADRNEDEEMFLDYILLFGDVVTDGPEEEQYLIDAGHIACEEVENGTPEDFSVNYLFFDAKPWLTKADAELVYESATMFLC